MTDREIAQAEKRTRRAAAQMRKWKPTYNLIVADFLSTGESKPWQMAPARKA